MTLEEVGEGVGLDNSTLSRIECGKARTKIATAAKLVKFFDGAITEMEILYPERFSDDAGHS